METSGNGCSKKVEGRVGSCPSPLGGEHRRILSFMVLNVYLALTSHGRHPGVLLGRQSQGGLPACHACHIRHLRWVILWKRIGTTMEQLFDKPFLPESQQLARVLPNSAAFRHSCQPQQHVGSHFVPYWRPHPPPF